MGTLNNDKELASTSQPLLLAVVTFPDASVLRLSTHDLSGGFAYGGNTYLPRVLNQEMAATEAMKDGIDLPVSVNLRLSDPDFYVWTNFEKLKGFKGAQLEMRAVLMDALTGTYSSDSRIIFRGICKEPGGRMPSHDGKVLSVGFVSRLQMADISIPPIRIQKTCPWSFPGTATERQDGADNSRSEFYRCGYSPDATGGNARGNLNGGSPFTTCNFTKEDCVARGMYTTDGSARITGRFGGVQWNPPQAQSVREYITGKWVQVQGGSNEARYGDNVPMLWGTAWTDPLILNTVPDGNFLKMEALICFGELDFIHEVLVNDVKIPHTYDDTEFTAVGPGLNNATEAARSGWWKTVNRGDRNGAPCSDAGFDSLGDPYGSLAVIEIVVPRKLADAGTIPRVRVLAARGTSNPATQIREILQDWAAWDTADLNTSSFTAAEAVCDELISYTTQHGVSGSRKRFTSNLYLRQRESAADLIRGLRNCMRGILGPDASGLLQLRVKRTIAAQQPSAISGSNYGTTVGGGYVAYKFDESNILEFPKVSLISEGNRFTFQFQNQDNRWSWDTFTPIDSEDIRRIQQEVPGQFSIKGADNYDQLYRLVATYLAERNRGNSRGDSGGTLVFDIVASVKAVHLAVGDICLFNFQPHGVANQPVRVVKIQPSTNFEQAAISLAWHDDAWYADTYGQKGQPKPTGTHRNRLLRPAYPWLPWGQAPETGDVWAGQFEYSFQVRQLYETAADGTGIAKLGIFGTAIVNNPQATPNPPFVPLQGSTASTGGTLQGGRAYYMALAPLDANGLLGALSPVVTIYVPSGTNTNTISVGGLVWDTGTTGWQSFVGIDPNKLSYQTTANTTPTSVGIGDLNVSAWGPPDTEFDRYRTRMKRVIHGGVFAAQVVSVTSTTIKLSVPDPLTVNQFANYDCSWLADTDSTTPLKIANWTVSSNTADTLTVTGPNPVTIGLAVGDVVVMRSKPTFGTDGTGDYISDANWVNVFAPSGMTPDAEIGNLIRFVHGTGQGQVARIKGNTATKLYADFLVQPDSTSRYIVEEPNWQVITDTASANNSDHTASADFTAEVTNYLHQTMLVQVLTVDGGDTESIEALSPIREIYLFGAPGALSYSEVTITADYTYDGSANLILADASGGPIIVTLPPVVKAEITVKKTDSSANTVTVVADAADDIDGDPDFVLTAEGQSIVIKAKL